MAKKAVVPGCIYLNNGRFWWRVKLPGDEQIKGRPLRPLGAAYATKDRSVAEALAQDLWRQAIFSLDHPVDAADRTVAGIAQRYLRHVKDYYRNPDGQESSEGGRVRTTIQRLIDICPFLPADEFGPLKLKEIRQAMIVENKGRLARSTINGYVAVIRRMFKWAVSEQLVPANVYHALQAVDGLRRGRSNAREPVPVHPVDEIFVRRMLPFASPTVRAMIDLQLLTGMRSGELVIMRPCDLDTSETVWTYRPATHKTAWRGLGRVVALGPKAQRILKPFLRRATTDYCFSPEETVQDLRAERTRNRKTPLSCGNRPGTNRKAAPECVPGERYCSTSYRRAVERAITGAKKAGVEVEHFHPHQLRHTAATRIRKKLGLDAARAMLGHQTLAMTDDYAEIDKTLAVKAARKFG